MSDMTENTSIQNKGGSDTMAAGMSRVDRLYEAMRAFAANLTEWDGEEMQGECIDDMAEFLTPETRAQLIFLLLTARHASDDLRVNTEGKQFAVVLAEKMGPDWAQWLYLFTKVVTRLA